jgi:hypothetical protein
MTVTMRKSLAALVSTCALAAVPGPVRAWNAGTHLYVAKKLLQTQVADPRLVMDAAYGANALDLFNNDFTSPALELQAWLHDPSGALFMRVWQAAATHAPAHRAFAFGLVSHNNAWGADSTAHVSGRTSGQGVGWVIAKGEILGAMLDPVLRDYGVILSPSQLVDVGHVLVEQAVDLLMLQVDPALGVTLMASAALRDPSDPAMLEVAWSGAFAGLLGSNAAAVRTIRAYEALSRESLVLYGWALSQPDALELLSGQIAVIAEGYLGLPPGAGAPLVPLIEYGILAGMQLCAPDFAQEIAATTAWVAGRMAAAGVTY